MSSKIYGVLQCASLDDAALILEEITGFEMMSRNADGWEEFYEYSLPGTGLLQVYSNFNAQNEAGDPDDRFEFMVEPEHPKYPFIIYGRDLSNADDIKRKLNRRQDIKVIFLEPKKLQL